MEGLSVIKNLFLGNLPTFGLTTRDQANISLTCLYNIDRDEIEFVPAVEVFNNTAFYPLEN
jgi:hypothetical protein